MKTAIFSFLGLPTDGRRRAIRAARQQFSGLNPGVPIAWCDMAAIEPQRFVVGIYFGEHRPRDCEFYAVDRTEFSATKITDPRYVPNGKR
jgi:hypothetical protein